LDALLKYDIDSKLLLLILGGVHNLISYLLKICFTTSKDGMSPDVSFEYSRLPLT